MKPHTRDDVRARIVEVAASLLREHGPSGVTTRGVAQLAGLQRPAIYRLFEDKEALLAAVAEHVLATYVEGKAQATETDDPVADLHGAWQTHIGFGLANPALFTWLADPARGARSPAMAAGTEVLRGRIRRVAAAGRLRVPEERAVEMIQAAGTGALLTLLVRPPEQRDPALADAMYEAVARTILTDAPVPTAGDTVAAVVAFRTVASSLTALTGAERALLTEWLDREAAQTPSR